MINFPMRILSSPLKWIVFPFWRNYRLPKDDLELKISKHMMEPSALRDRLMQNCIPVKPIEQTWRKMLEVEPLFNLIDQAIKNGAISKKLDHEKRIEQAVALKIITMQEATLLHEFAAMQLDALQVDEFTNAELTGHEHG